MGRRATLAWLVAVIAGVFMVVPTLASAQEQGSTDTQLTDEVTADDETSTEAPPAETPPADPPAEPVEPVEPTETPTEPETTIPDSQGFDGSADTSKASEPATSSDAAAAPAPTPDPEPADVAAVEAEATDSPGNDGGARTTAGRALADGGGKLEATKSSSVSKPGCLARGGAGEIHNTFPDDGSCAQSLFDPQGPGPFLPSAADGVSDLSLVGPNGTVNLDIWSADDGITVNATVLTGGPVGLSLYVKGGTPHNVCTDNSIANGETLTCGTAINPNNGNPFGFSHLDVCVRPPTVEENPPPVVIDTPPDEQVTPPEEVDVLTEEEREQEQREELEEAVPPTAIPTAVTPAPTEALPFTGLDTGWLVLLSLGMLGTGVLLRRKVS